MVRAQRRKYHYIYKITRFDGKYYIGLHSTDNLEDGYFGSGKRLWYSINKHGKDKHSKEILEFLPDRASLVAREKELVCKELLEDALCMNITLGGNGGWHHITAEQHAAGGRAAGKLTGKINGPKNLALVTSEHRKKANETRIKNGKPASMTGKKHTESAKLKISQANSGSGNPHFGKRYIHSVNLQETRLILKDDPLPDDFHEGKLPKYTPIQECKYCGTWFRKTNTTYCSEICLHYGTHKFEKVIDDNIEFLLEDFKITKSISKTLLKIGLDGRKGNAYFSSILKRHGFKILKRRNTADVA